MNHWHTALVLWDSHARGQGSQPLVNLAEKAARLLDAPRPLTLLESTHDVWCWDCNAHPAGRLRACRPRPRARRATGARHGRDVPARRRRLPHQPRRGHSRPAPVSRRVPHAARRRVRGRGSCCSPGPRRRDGQADGDQGDRADARCRQESRAGTADGAGLPQPAPERRRRRPTCSSCTRTRCVTGCRARRSCSACCSPTTPRRSRSHCATCRCSAHRLGPGFLPRSVRLLIDGRRR